MERPEIVVVAAMDEKNGIGKGGQVPWKIPEDMKHFREVTLNHPVIMGRVTWESLPPSVRPFPHRFNIVVTKSKDFNFPGVEVAHSIKEALKTASLIDTEKIIVIGGAQIFTLALPFVDKLDLTLVTGNFNCDTFFPTYQDIFDKVISEKVGQHDNLKYKFLEIVPGK